MTAEPQDRVFLASEADAFFTRNFAQADPGTLRPSKRTILEALRSAGVRPRRVLEYGCGYGDLLAHLAREDEVVACCGVEPSAKAVALGREAYGDAVDLRRGTLADDPFSADPARAAGFDLIVVEDVFCWVSRSTILQSVANLDRLLAEGGHLFIREFLPLANERNRSHHVQDAEVWCYKPAGPHYRIFTSTGAYAVIQQRVWVDHADGWVREGARNAFESRWVDSVLHKSYSEHFR